MKFRKGQAILLSHAIVVGFTIVLVLVVVTTFTTIKNDYQEFIATNEIQQVCYALRSAVDRVVPERSYLSPVETRHGSIRVLLPERIAELKYRTSFSNSSLFVETLTQPVINYTCRLGHNASYVGFASGGLTEISYISAANGTAIINFTKVG